MDKLYYSYQFSIGFNDKNTKKQEFSTEEILSKIETLTAEILGWWNISNVERWVWKYEDWTIAWENSVKVFRETPEDNSELVNKFTKTIKKVLNQESVLVKLTRNRVEFA